MWICENITNVKYTNMLTNNQVNKNFNWTQGGSHKLISYFMSHMMVTENIKNLHKVCSGAFATIFICSMKINIIICETHSVNLIF